MFGRQRGQFGAFDQREVAQAGDSGRDRLGRARRRRVVFLTHQNQRVGADPVQVVTASGPNHAVVSASTIFLTSSGRAAATAKAVLPPIDIPPGVGLVENEIKPYAQAWHERNLAALASADPLWVVPGDSLSQGVGASSIEHSWVLQTWRALADRGVRYRDPCSRALSARESLWW
jgi:hypothetical protein